MNCIWDYVDRTITSLHFSPNATEAEPTSWLLSGSLDETVMVWNVDINPIEVCSLSNSAFNAVWSQDHPNDYLLAAAGTDNRIQVMSSESDKTIFTTEEESPDTVEKCVVSHDTTMVAWFTQSGRIKLLSLKSKLVKVLGQHPDANLTVLKFSPKDVLLVSCSLDGSIKIHQVWQPNDKCVTIAGPKMKVIDCYFVENEESLLTCGSDGSIRLWNVKNGEPITILLRSLGLDVICIDRTLDNLWFAQGTISHGLQLFSIRLELRKALRQPTRLGFQNSPVRICRFADHIQYLAVGYDSGLIEVFNYTRNMLVSTLEAHQSWVRDLRFVSRSPYFQLVSSGDRIAWWDLNQTQPNSLGRGGNLHPVANGSPKVASSAGSSSGNGHLHSSAHHWSSMKTIHPELVQTLEFQGRFASQIFPSQDGQVILTVTDSGILYILRQLVDF